ncbi:MAG TPA: sigma 54-interacting transcriptional regulator [Longimicrobium sp.]|jgi:DNA-binding NtrC family response regulator|nr:sigma 54-interacting transcriptional regulator [Longimicrobium sp.]
MSIAESLEEHRLPPRAGNLLLPDMLGFARVAAESGHSVLITGETGCGKTHLARLVHQSGPRAARPFVRVNCAAIPDSLFEREMFGHVKGAYTDARDAAAGFLEAAHGGTLFLDEIAELAPQNQPKLLAVLEDGCFRKLGSPVESRADVQVIAAANRDLPEMVRTKQFRQDLFYRISVLRYTVAPLRERRSEIPALVEQLLEKVRRPDGPRAQISLEALAVLRRHSWPGNIRELENALRAATAFSGGGEVRPEHLPEEVRDPGAHRRSTAAEVPARMAERYSAPPTRHDEHEMIRRALDEAGGNKTTAARRLGMSRSTLWAKLQRYG